MPTVQMYRSQSGNIFETEFEEHRDDLRAMIAEMVENDAIAKKLTDKLTNGAFASFHAVVTAMYSAHYVRWSSTGGIVTPPVEEDVAEMEEQQGNWMPCNIQLKLRGATPPMMCASCGIDECPYVHPDGSPRDAPQQMISENACTFAGVPIEECDKAYASFTGVTKKRPCPHCDSYKTCPKLLV